MRVRAVYRSPLMSEFNRDLLTLNKKFWRQKIANLINESGIEDSLHRELTENTSQRKSLLWRIDHMNYSAEELKEMYRHIVPVIANSSDQADRKRREKEKKSIEKLKSKKSW